MIKKRIVEEAIDVIVVLPKGPPNEFEAALGSTLLDL